MPHRQEGRGRRNARSGEQQLAASAFIAVCPSTLDPTTHLCTLSAGKAPHVYAAIREMTRRAAAGAPGPAAVPLAALAGTDLAGFADATPCGFLHPHESCNHHMLSHVPPAYVRALPVYFSGGGNGQPSAAAAAAAAVGRARASASSYSACRHGHLRALRVYSAVCPALTPPSALPSRPQCTSSPPSWCTASACCSPTARRSCGGEAGREGLGRDACGVSGCAAAMAATAAPLLARLSPRAPSPLL